MKLSTLFIAAFILLLAPKAILAQGNTPASTVKKLFVLFDNPNELINKEINCYAKTEGYDILKLNKPFIVKYLAHLKNTGLFSKNYLSNQNQYYQELQKDISKNGSAEGRDSDIYTISQDPPSGKVLIAALQKITPVITGNKAKLTFRFKNEPSYKLVYRLVKEDNNWLIDDINSI